MIYLDHAATSFPKPPAVVAAMTSWFERVGVSAERGEGPTTEHAARVVADCRRRLAELTGWPAGACRVRELGDCGARPVLARFPATRRCGVDHRHRAQRDRPTAGPSPRTARHPTSTSCLARPWSARSIRTTSAASSPPVATGCWRSATRATSRARSSTPPRSATWRASTARRRSWTHAKPPASSLWPTWVRTRSRPRRTRRCTVPQDSDSWRFAPIRPPTSRRLWNRERLAERDRRPRWIGCLSSGRTATRAARPNMPAIFGLHAALEWLASRDPREDRTSQLATIDRLRERLLAAGDTCFGPTTGPRLPILSFASSTFDTAEAGMLLANASIHVRSGHHLRAVDPRGPWHRRGRHDSREPGSAHLGKRCSGGSGNALRMNSKNSNAGAWNSGGRPLGRYLRRWPVMRARA